MAWTIRTAAAADEAATVALWREAGLVVTHNDPNADFRFARAGSCSDVLLASSENGALVGAVMVGHDGHRGWIYYLASRERRGGIGRRLVGAAEDWLAAHGIRKMQLMIRSDSAGVAAFYETLGFEVTPRIVMAKWIESS